jgi:uncharacterized protein (TIGR03084 family)
MLQQITDFRDEVAELSRLLKQLRNDDWSRATLFKGWTINDVILHLYASDYVAAASVRSPDEYAQLRGDMQQKRRSGLSMIEESRLRFPDLKGNALFKLWELQANELCSLLSQRDPQERLSWSGPDMSVRMFVTARQMETWAHGQEIYDVMGVERVSHDRIKNIVTIGVKTFGWSFANRGLDIPTEVPRIELIGPSGDVWTWNSEASENLIQGSAVEFCQVTTQVRNIEDTELSVRGDVATKWMQIAQCFAGPPVDPPAPGSRHKSALS